MKSKEKRFFGSLAVFFTWLISSALLSLFFSFCSHAGTIYDSPYVTFSPDGQAFTTCAGDREVQWYENGLVTQMSGKILRELMTGEHYYRAPRTRSVPVGYWKVMYRPAKCIHDVYPPVGADYHGVPYGRVRCFTSYYSGWMAYCADCGERITDNLFYMNQEAARSISELDLEKDYYYLCPFCSNLEMGANLGVHFCSDISWNRYQVRYDKNTNDWVEGYMENSTHMYQNARMYDGQAIDADTKLRKNTFQRVGYFFAGWNTLPDGTGQSFLDEQEILNLTTENYDQNGNGIVTLYAQWIKVENTLLVDPAGGIYQGKRDVCTIKIHYGESYELDMGSLKEPEGRKVSFETNGGNCLNPITGEIKFEKWIPQEPFYGYFSENVYYCITGGGEIDTIAASYQKEPVYLPETEKPGYSFRGWYQDSECTIFVGRGGDPYIPEEDVTLYAAWEADFVLTASIERILEPKEPVFRRGECGKLRFMVSGFAEKVEVVFPEDLAEGISDTKFVFPYDGKELCHEEEILFMVPLYTPKGEYPVRVQAWRGNAMLSESPALWIVGDESVLDDLRSRLR